MSDHINQHTLESIILNPRLTLPVRPASTKRKRGEQAGGGQAESVSAEDSARINAHLAECSLCTEEWRKLKDLYGTIEEDLKQSPTQRDKEFAQGLLESKRIALPERGLEVRPRDETLRETLESYAEVIEPYRRSFVQKFVGYVRIYPVRTAGATAFAVAAVVLSLLFTRTPKDENPSFAAVKNASLGVYNREGEVLWTQSALGIPDLRSDQPFYVMQTKRNLTVTDVDGDGISEVLVSGVGTGGDFATDTLYCFEKNGKLRWRTGAGRMISFGKRGVTQHSTTLIVNWLIVRKQTEERNQLFVISRDEMFSPAKLFEVDTKTGRELQSYFHRGHCPFLLSGDVNADGFNELILGGLNDGFNQASLAILDPSNIGGFAPVPEEYLPVDSVPRASEEYYILFPKTDLGELLRWAPFNQVSRITPATGNLIVHVNESTGNPKGEENGSVVYTFDDMMGVKAVMLGDPFKVLYARLNKEGKLKQPLTPAYTENLKNSVLYWDGERSRFVSYNDLTKTMKSGMP